MKNKNQILLAALLVAVVVFFYIWPGVWRYKYYSRSFSRLDTITGQRQEYRQASGRWLSDAEILEHVAQSVSRTNLYVWFDDPEGIVSQAWDYGNHHGGSESSNVRHYASRWQLSLMRGVYDSIKDRLSLSFERGPSEREILFVIHRAAELKRDNGSPMDDKQALNTVAGLIADTWRSERQSDSIFIAAQAKLRAESEDYWTSDSCCEDEANIASKLGPLLEREPTDEEVMSVVDKAKSLDKTNKH